jgi:hypothetical protein
MTPIKKSDLVRVVGQKHLTQPHRTRLQKALSAERLASDSNVVRYDVFLSHSFLDRDTILRLNYIMEEELGLEVYVDWIEDAEMDRSIVTPDNAAHVRKVMRRCSSLVFAVSRNSASSKWMPWELGYSDGLHGRAAVLVIDEENATLQAYQNQEFVGIYPFAKLLPALGTGQETLWIYDAIKSNTYARIDNWARTGTLVTR